MTTVPGIEQQVADVRQKALKLGECNCGEVLTQCLTVEALCEVARQLAEMNRTLVQILGVERTRR